ncbi:MAG: FAD-dependent oxidoreductase, partial [Alphaproteobacteria bacterium]|nr:FAD-dependent oxidoreductase [Alphaproteobacteria bacterium]
MARPGSARSLRSQACAALHDPCEVTIVSADGSIPLPFRLPQRQALDIAVIGAGIAGMGAAWLLSQLHRVTLYEREGRFGGHSNTVEVACGDRITPV